jgi:hypothetical protein
MSRPAVDDLDEEFVEIIAAVGPRRRGQIAAAARAVAGDIRADADQLGTAAIHASVRTGLKILGCCRNKRSGRAGSGATSWQLRPRRWQATLSAGERLSPAARVKTWSYT